MDERVKAEIERGIIHMLKETVEHSKTLAELLRKVTASYRRALQNITPSTATHVFHLISWDLYCHRLMACTIHTNYIFIIPLL